MPNTPLADTGGATGLAPPPPKKMRRRRKTRKEKRKRKREKGIRYIVAYFGAV